MFPASLVQFKAILAVVTAAFGAAAGGSMLSSMYNNNDNSNGRFLVAVNPAMLPVTQGGSVNTTVTVTSINGYSGTVALSVFNIGSFSSRFNPSSVRVHSDGSAKSILTISAPSTLKVGNYTVAIVGTSSRRNAYAATFLTLHVSSSRDFAITTEPSTINNTPGATNYATVTVTSLNGYNGTISLQATVPFGYITLTGGQNMLYLASGQSVATTVTITTSTQTSVGTYPIVITGSSGGVSHSATMSLVVSDPVITEALVFAGYSFNSDTNMTMNIQNTGTGPVTLQSYTVIDSSGDTWSYSWSNGPVILAGTTVAVFIVVGMGCNGCTYTGILGLFNQFTVGQSYTVTLTTRGGHLFSSVVTR